MKNLRSFTLLLLAFSLTFCQAQNIKRKILFGTYTVDITDSIADVLKLDNNKGTLIQKVVPQTTADNLKLTQNDVILKINNIEIENSQGFVSLIKSYREGEKVVVDYVRNGEHKRAEGIALAKPKETSEDYEVIYDEAKFNDGYIRIIINKPHGIAKAPAIVFIPGYMCYSLDNIGKHPYGQLIDGLTKKGYVLIRVEKLGEGDCLNTPNCIDVDFETELAGFEAGIRSLNKYDFIDQENIFIWGHSLGAIEATFLAERTEVKGIIVNGTTAYSWFEYLIAMSRFQEPLLGADYVEIDEEMQDYIKFQYEFLVLKKTPLELSKNEAYTKIMEEQQFDGKDKIFMRNYRYWQQLEDAEKAKALKNSNAYVLSIWNSFDLEAFSEQDHKAIIDMVNYYHPGKGTYIKLENTTHSFTKVESMQQGVENHSNYSFIYENFNPEITEITHKWIQSVLQKKL